ncbi:MAG TPA: DUF456 family protein [Candidatus Limnocylindria bacterium]|nr:DUF456 family protein [Candidatus Limnocylindria bacterium]
MTLVDIVVGLLMAAGLAGTVVPMLPGAPLVFAGALLHAYATDFATIGLGRLALLAVLAAAASGLEYLAGALGAQRFGGTRAAVIGALIGTVVGLAWPPFGLLICPIAGAIAGQIVSTRHVAGSVRTGVGTALGLLTGVLMHLALAVVMIALFAWWVWRG